MPSIKCNGNELTQVLSDAQDALSAALNSASAATLGAISSAAQSLKDAASGAFPGASETLANFKDELSDFFGSGGTSDPSRLADFKKRWGTAVSNLNQIFSDFQNGTFDICGGSVPNVDGRVSASGALVPVQRPPETVLPTGTPPAAAQANDSLAIEKNSTVEIIPSAPYDVSTSAYAEFVKGYDALYEGVRTDKVALMKEIVQFRSTGPYKSWVGYSAPEHLQASTFPVTGEVAPYINLLRKKHAIEGLLSAADSVLGDTLKAAVNPSDDDIINQMRIKERFEVSGYSRLNEEVKEYVGRISRNDKVLYWKLRNR